jgi:outer membrane lipoprotein-sorting protein
MRRLSSRARWAVPAGTVAVVGIVVAATTMASASEPSLPARTPAQLLTEVQQAAARPLSPQTATIQETANLGIPALPQIGAMNGPSGPQSSLNLLAGTTTVDLWYLNPTHLRIAEPTQMGESDLRLDGTRLWLWDSRTQSATHVLLPAKAVRRSPNFASPPAAIGSPAAVARRLLADVGPTTSVTVGPNATVAGRSAYQLVIAPKTAGSLIGQIVIAIDASSHLPLRVQVFGQGTFSPAFQVGYTALSFGAPAASNFTFTPPPGAKVKTVTVPDKVPAGLSPANLGAVGAAGLGAAGLGAINPGGPMVGAGSAASSSSASGSPVLIPPVLISPLSPPPGPGSVIGKAVVIYPGSPSGLRPPTARQLRADLLAHLPKNLTKAQRAAMVRALAAKVGSVSLTAQPPASLGPDRPRVMGAGWTAVIATPPSPAVAAAVQQLLSGHAAGSQTSTIYGYGASSAVSVSTGSVSTGSVSTGSVSAVSASPSPVPVGPDLAILQALLRASTPVSGSWGSGRLIRSALLTVLVTSKGQVLVGAVTPSVLYADVAALSR